MKLELILSSSRSSSTWNSATVITKKTVSYTINPLSIPRPHFLRQMPRPVPYSPSADGYWIRQAANRKSSWRNFPAALSSTSGQSDICTGHEYVFLLMFTLSLCRICEWRTLTTAAYSLLCPRSLSVANLLLSACVLPITITSIYDE